MPATYYKHKRSIDRKLIAFANEYIDRLCEMGDVRETIQSLFEFGFTKDELLVMGFDSNDVEFAVNQYLEESPLI